MKSNNQNSQPHFSDPRFAKPVDERVLTVDDLARMFNVSTKTVTRWRDSGLASSRFDINGRQRVGFLKSSVDRFVAQNPDRVRRGASFSQLTDHDRAEIVEHARLLADSGQSRQAVLKQVAGTMNRSIETVRSTIKRFDRAHPESAVFGDSGGTLTADLRSRIYRQYCRGASVAELATSHQRSAANIHRIINSKRAERILELPLEYVASAEFGKADAEATLLGPMPQPEHAPRRARAPSGLPPYLASLYEFPLLTKEQEVHLFRKYNYAKYRASQLREQLDPERPAAQLLGEIERIYRLAVDTKNQIMQANLRLVVAIVKKSGAHAESFHERISDGNISLLKAIEKFDYTRGFKFSTYASWAIKRNSAGNYVRQMKQADRYRTGHDEVLDSVPGYRANHYVEEAAQERHEAVVGKILDCLDRRERGIIERRFGLGSDKEPQTLKEIGDDLRVSKERVRQIETRAIGKLREAIGGQRLEALVGSLS